MAKIPARTVGELIPRTPESYVTERVLLPTYDLVHRAGTSGALLLVAAIVAMVWANSPWRDTYHALWETPISLSFGGSELTKTLHHLVNDGLMALFFFLVGLEIKRELVRGELSSRQRALMPLIGALGGMIAPAAIYAFWTAGTTALRGWGIPMATDIAFALAVLALLGKRIPSELRVLLLAIAIVDDLGSIVVIAVFYTAEINVTALALASVVAGAIVGMRLLGFRALPSYAVVGVVLWLAVLQSGVHATLAGVILGALTPLRPHYESAAFAAELRTLQADYEAADKVGDIDKTHYVLGKLEELARGTESPLERAERVLHPWVVMFVLPLFALANTGLTLSSTMLRDAINSPVTGGIVAGLVLGKFSGIFLSCWIAARLGIAQLPTRVRWAHVAGMAAIAGIGFTVSLFIADLSFAVPSVLEHAKVGVLLASIVAAALGLLITFAFLPKSASAKRGALNGHANAKNVTVH